MNDIVCQPFGGNPFESSNVIALLFRHKRERLVGHYAFSARHLLLTDLDLMKAVMIKDFDHFTDRRTVQLNTDNPINKLTMGMATNLKGETWKLLRNIISPIFTSGKLKGMTQLVQRVRISENDQF